MKQFRFSILLVGLLCMFKVNVLAHDIEAKNADGVTIYYNYSENGKELFVTYRGVNYYSYSDEYTGNIVIPEEVSYMNRVRKVTKIENDAFHDCSKLTSVTIPDNVINIGDYAFSDCYNLTSVTIPSSVTNIGRNAFDGCSDLISVTIPNNVTNIKIGTFGDCSSITSITIPTGVTSIEGWAFSGCSSLKSITIPNNVTSIGEKSFSGCSAFTFITIPSSVIKIGKGAFANCSSLASIVSLIEEPCPIVGKNDNFNNTFPLDVFYNATLYIPTGTINKYKLKEGWKDFAYIVEGIPTEVSNVSASPVMIQNNGGMLTVHGVHDGTEVEVYSLSGVSEGSAISQSGQATVNTNLQPGSVAIVKIGTKSIKLLMK